MKIAAETAAIDGFKPKHPHEGGYFQLFFSGTPRP